MRREIELKYVGTDGLVENTWGLQIDSWEDPQLDAIPLPSLSFSVDRSGPGRFCLDILFSGP